jgi:hypothetical protein
MLRCACFEALFYCVRAILGIKSAEGWAFVARAVLLTLKMARLFLAA